MAQLTINLPDDLEPRLAARAAESGTSVEEHVAALISAYVEGSEEGEDYGAPAHLHVSSADELEHKLIEGLQSPAREMTPADWAEMKCRLVERHGGGGGGG